MSTVPQNATTATAATASPTTADIDFFDTFPQRLAALAGILNAIDESGWESRQSIFFPATLSYLAVLAGELAVQFQGWAKTHDARPGAARRCRMNRTPLSPADALRQELLEFIDVLYLLSHLREEDLDAAGRLAGVFGHCARFLDTLETRQQAAAGEGGAA